MRVLRCTQKVLDLMGVKSRELEEPGAANGVLKEWYVHLMWIDRRKWLLFVDAETLYVCVVPNVVKKDVEHLPVLFAEQLQKNLRNEGIPEEVIGRVAAVEPFQLGKTKDRRVVGSMNDLIYQYKSHIESRGGLPYTDLRALSHWMNKVPMGMLGMDSSLKALHKQLYK